MILQWLHFTWMYLQRPPWDSGITPPELTTYLDTHAPGRAIDLGCGTGTNVITLAQYGWRVTGVDFIPRAISMAKRKIKKANIQADLRVGDVMNLHGINGPFDMALDIGCFHGMQDKSAYLDELGRLLAAHGHWLLYGFFRSASGMTGPGLNGDDLDEIQSRGFSLLSRTDGFDRKERPSVWLLFEKVC
jgi:SAM-dependent methyltransferase